MATKHILALILALAAQACSTNTFKQGSSPQKKHSKPNIIFVLVDDLGYGELGSFGQEKIKTPNLDLMAKEGTRFTSFYAGSTVCAPSRSALMTGKHTGHNQIRGNYEFGGFRDEEEFGQMPLRPNTFTIAKMLKEANYTTALVGKWGLGGPNSFGVPNLQGFDHFYGYLDQKQAHNHTPTHLWRNEQKENLNNEFIHPHQKLDPIKSIDFKQFVGEDFAQDRLTKEAITFISDNAAQPFFLYLSYAGPHAALQAPNDQINKYDFKDDKAILPTEGNYVPSKKPRATRAAMVSYIDEHVGQILQALKNNNIDENTLVIFTSDNGPSFEGGAELEFFDANGPYRGYKRDLYEGGIRVPMIARWPNKIPTQSTVNTPYAFWDVMPTLAQVANIELSKPTDGTSFYHSLTNNAETEQMIRPLYWEFHHASAGKSQAVRLGKWKGVKVYHTSNKGKATATFELFNLEDDPSESTDLSSAYPEVAARLNKIMQLSRTTSWVESWNFN